MDVEDSAHYRGRKPNEQRVENVVFSLVERNGNDVTLSMKSLQTAPRQRANLPGVPAGTKVSFISRSASARGWALRPARRSTWSG
jgi:hypothetical protein